jgi:ABC-type branched-subunit amino acid transport system substrate-binding protein
MDIADKLIADNDIKAVIGPLTSSEVFDVAPKFINGKKVLIAPVATAANISRAFAGTDYFWRLTEPDISQARTLLLLAKKGGAQTVGLITEETPYGASFEDWFGYFATELGLKVSKITVLDPADIKGCKTAWDEIAATHPDAVVAALSSSAMHAETGKAFRANGQQIRLLFSDSACIPSLLTNLGSLAENLEGISLATDPTSAFDLSYIVKYNKYPESGIANMYDAVLLIALALESSGGEGGDALVEAMKKVVSGREGKVKWQRDELKNALQLIKSGIYPDLKGASGDLNFDELYFTDVSSTTYGHWRVDAGQFVTTDFYTSDGKGRISSTSAAYQVIAEKKQQFSTTGTWPLLQPKQRLFAFLMATSQGWSNYRHQSDVLKTYQLLKAKGLPDDQIILVLADDLATSPSNKKPGVVVNDPNGVNLYQNVKVDYKLNNISSQAIANIFSGTVTASTPIVFNTLPTDNIFIFTVGHGTPDGMSLEGTNQQSLTPSFWQSVFNTMNQKKNFRQVFWSCEACYSGKIGLAVSTPGVMIMTGANPYETSKAYLYDSEQKIWLADKFAYSINNAIAASPNLRFNELYERCFSFVNGSHISFYNYQNFGNIYQLTFNDFLSP